MKHYQIIINDDHVICIAQGNNIVEAKKDALSLLRKAFSKVPMFKLRQLRSA
tara:strand:+ start:377 stop:532 length:156 start_codon:yes stop_codon:yes gene_type:complete